MILIAVFLAAGLFFWGWFITTFPVLGVISVIVACLLPFTCTRRVGD
jgi:hypothetical protein